ncbi:MAG: hypothetical protein EU529_16165 [Promethearchaeota archaeon]|nr:MAG: hypothetical protein EU529_16165 [Candidatus Lokiarchaeota archaeon]
MKEKYCYYCGKRLDLSSLICKNFHLNQDYLKTLWNNSSIQFLCCDCYKEEMLSKKGLLKLPEQIEEKLENEIQ